MKTALRTLVRRAPGGILGMILAFILGISTIHGQAASAYSLIWTVFAGGGESQSGPYVLRSSIGLSGTGPASGGTYTVAGGFLNPAVMSATVVYTFSGFFPPVDNLPVVNSVNAGKAIPVKFSLGGDYGLAIFEAGYPKSQVVACNSTDPVDGIEETVSAGQSILTYDPVSGQYAYVWKTNKAWAGTCRQFVLRLTDGATHRANFKFK